VPIEKGYERLDERGYRQPNFRSTAEEAFYHNWTLWDREIRWVRKNKKKFDVGHETSQTGSIKMVIGKRMGERHRYGQEFLRYCDVGPFTSGEGRAQKGARKRWRMQGKGNFRRAE